MCPLSLSRSEGRVEKERGEGGAVNGGCGGEEK